MKVYAVTRSYDNGKSYEDHSWYDDEVEVVCATKERALRYIKKIETPESYTDREHWVEGEPYPKNPTQCIRQFYMKRFYNRNQIEQIWYNILEMEVIE